MNDGLKDKHRKAILEVLEKHPKIERVVLFGSRAMGTFTPTSDIDIALYGNLSMQDQARIAEELDELPIPYTVDLVRMKTVTSSELLAHVKEHGKEWTANTRTTLPLAECMAAIIDYRGKTPTKTTYGVPLVTAKIVKSGRIEEPAEFIAEADFDTWMRRGMPNPGDIVMTTEAPLGEVAQLDGRKVALAQRVITLRGKPDLLDNTFLKFLLQSAPVQEELLSRGTGTTVVGIKQSELRKVSLSFPPLAEQKAIAAVLGALDDKIELNRRMNATLEAMARALFQSWFVDFDPVRAKLDGRQPEGMDAETAALFPDCFQDAEMGNIPRGWTAARMPEAIEINPRRTLKKGIEAPYLDMKNLPLQGHSANEVVERIFTSGTKFQNGDTLLARITPCLENGKTGYVDFLEEAQVGWGSTEYIVLAPKPPLPPQFGYLLARSDGLRTHAIQNMTGTSGRQRVPAECFDSYWLAIPSAEIALRFDELTAPLMAKIKANSDESRTLATLRDTLLPKLLSGELSIKPVATDA